MTIYGEGDEVFRQRPAVVAFFITALCIFVLAAQFTTLGLSLLDAAFARLSGWQREWFLYAPLADDFQHRLLHIPPLADTYRLVPVLIATVSMVVALVLALFWPVEGRVASILAVYSFALALLTWGALAIAFDPFLFEDLERRTQVQPIIWSALVGLVALRAVVTVERKTLQILANVLELRSAGQRMIWWMLRLVPAFSVLGALSLLNGYRPGAYAAGAVLVVSLLENLARVPRQTFQTLKSPRLWAAAAVMPLVTAAVVAGSIHVFGMAAVDRARQVVAYKPPLEVRVETLADAKKSTEPILEIKWAKPR
jgi:hypothetical protein